MMTIRPAKIRKTANLLDIGANIGERTMIFMHGPSFYNAHKCLGMTVDYTSLRELYELSCELVNFHHYNVLPSDPEIESPIYGILTFLERNRFIVHIKYAEMMPALGDRPERLARVNLAPEISVDMLKLVIATEHRDPIKRVIIFGTDPDLEAGITALGEFGVKVTVIGVTNASLDPAYGTPPGLTVPGYAAATPNIRSCANHFLELGKLRAFIHSDELAGQNARKRHEYALQEQAQLETIGA
jgi:uncharacterized LabA/DUF88 family protein